MSNASAFAVYSRTNFSQSTKGVMVSRCMWVENPGIGEKQTELVRKLKPNFPNNFLLIFRSALPILPSLALKEAFLNSVLCFLMVEDFVRNVNVILLTCLQWQSFENRIKEDLRLPGS